MAAAAGSNIQLWGEYSEDEAQADKKEVESKSKFYKFKGKSQVRFLPPKKGQKNPFVKTWQHFVNLIPGNDESKVVFNCPRKMNKAACPLCVQAEKLRSTGKKVDRDRGYELLPKFRAYGAMVDRKDEEAGVQVAAVGQKIFSQLVNLREDADFTHPINGFDIIVTRKGEGKNDTEYTVRGARGESPISDDVEVMQEWHEQMPDLAQYAFVPTFDEIKETIDEALERGESSGNSGGRGFGGGGPRQNAQTAERPRTKSRLDEDEDDAPRQRASQAARGRPIDTVGVEVGDDNDESDVDWEP